MYNRLVELAKELVNWRYCMSYNDSYFGEPEGQLKRMVADIDRLLPLSTQQPQAWIIERPGNLPVMCYYESCAQIERERGSHVTPYYSQVTK